MSLWTIIASALLLAAAARIIWSPGPDEPASQGQDAGKAEGAAEPAPASRSEHIATRLFGYFGIGRIPRSLGLAVLLATAAIVGLGLDALASLHLGSAYPAWFPVLAMPTGLGMGLLSTRLLAASYPRDER